MRILLISPAFPPQHNVAALRVHALARHWAEAGVQVEVLTTAKRADHAGLALPCEGFDVAEIDFRVPRVLERLRATHKTHESTAERGGRARAGAEAGSSVFRRLRSWRARLGIFSGVRMPDLTDFWVKPALAWCRARGPWDAVVSSSGPYTAHLVAMAVRSDGQAGRWVADFRDLWTDNHSHCGLLPFTLRERRLEGQCLRHVEALTTVSDGLARELRGKTAAAVHVVYNGFDPDEIATLPGDPVFPDDGVVRLVYTGSYYPAGQNPRPLLEAIARVVRTDARARARLRLVIAGERSELWRDEADRCGCGGLVDVHGTVDRSVALRMQRDAAALIHVDWCDPDRGVLTGKLFEYLAASAPIFVVGGAERSPVTRFVREAGRGEQLGDDADRIAAAIADLLDGRAPFAMERNDGFIDRFTRRRQSLRMLEIVRPAGA